MSGFEVDVIRADGMSIATDSSSQRPSIAIVSVSVIDTGAFALRDWEQHRSMPVIWVGAAAPRARCLGLSTDYSHILPLDFTGAELRRMIAKLAQQLHAHGEQVQGSERADRAC